MKILIYSHSQTVFDEIRSFAKEKDQVILPQVICPSELFEAIPAFDPHIVVIHSPLDEEESVILDYLIPANQSIRFVFLKYQTPCLVSGWKAQLSRAIKKGVITPPLQISDPAKRRTILAAPFAEFLKSKPETLPNGVEIRHQCHRLMGLLHRAIIHSQEIDAYKNTLDQVMPSIWLEICRHQQKSDFNAVLLARVQIGRYLSLLAHYIPGVPLEHLPRAVDSNPECRFFHYGGDPSSFQVFVCLTGFGIKYELAVQIIDLNSWVYSGQTALEIANTTTVAMGLLHSLQQITEANLRQIARILDNNRLGENSPNGWETFDRELWGEFWGIEPLTRNSGLVAKITQTLIESEGELPKEWQFPPFEPHFDPYADEGGQE